MKVSFFLLKFPLSSETFVLNQITAFIDMGHEVEIVALQKGDTQHTHIPLSRRKNLWIMKAKSAGLWSLSKNRISRRRWIPI